MSNPVGRPEKPIDWKIVEDLCNIQCTHEEIASFCKVTKDTLYDRAVKEYGDNFSTVYKRFSEGGKSSLRRTQFRMSEKNCAMAIWLGKQYLGQMDTPKDEHTDVKSLMNLAALMDQLNKLQARNIDDNSNKADTKSE